MSTVARQEGVSATEAELIEFAKKQIAAHKVPEKVVFLPSLPKSGRRESPEKSAERALPQCPRLKSPVCMAF